MEAKTMVFRVTSIEFELNNGWVFEMPIELEKVPTLEEFQKVYDQWHQDLRVKQ